MDLSDYYKILGVDEKASMEDIHQKYVQLVKKYHPDLYYTNVEKLWASERFIMIDSAYKKILETRIQNEEEKKLATIIVDKLLEKLDYKIHFKDKTIFEMDAYLLGAFFEIAFLFAVVVIMASFNFIFGIVLFPILIAGFVYMWKVRKRV